MVERSKLRPVNMSKHDATKAIFRERMNMGASMADIQPMEMDMGVTFESVGGVDDHVNSLREMVIFPLLYPEIFSKFKITPPRGIQFFYIELNIRENQVYTETLNSRNSGKCFPK